MPGSKYVSVMPLENAATKSGKLEPEALNETNMLELYVFASEKHRQAVLVARLDNLGKGASGAAVQNMRLMLGLAGQVGNAGAVDDDTLQFYRRHAEAYAQREITSRQARMTRFLAPLPPGAASSNSDAAPAAIPRKCWRAGFDVARPTARRNWPPSPPASRPSGRDDAVSGISTRSRPMTGCGPMPACCTCPASSLRVFWRGSGAR